MRRSQLFGLLLWRAGLLLVGGYSALRMVRLAWEHLDLPPLMDWGLGFLVAGAGLVGASLVMERMVDQRSEGELSQ